MSGPSDKLFRYGYTHPDVAEAALRHNLLPELVASSAGEGCLLGLSLVAARSNPHHTFTHGTIRRFRIVASEGLLHSPYLNADPSRKPP